jgi:hypothetical protein
MVPLMTLDDVSGFYSPVLFRARAIRIWVSGVRSLLYGQLPGYLHPSLLFIHKWYSFSKSTLPFLI